MCLNLWHGFQFEPAKVRKLLVCTNFGKLIFWSQLFGGNDDIHPFSLQSGELLGSAVVDQFIDKPQKNEFSAVLKGNGSASELHIGLDLAVLFQELGGMFYLEFKIVVIRVGAKPDLLDDHLDRFCLDLLVLFLLEIQELVEIYDFTYRRLGLGSDFHQVCSHIIGPLKGGGGILDPGFNGFSCDLGYFVEIFTNQSDGGTFDLFVDAVLAS